jgi:hypothetical protein
MPQQIKEIKDFPFTASQRVPVCVKFKVHRTDNLYTWIISRQGEGRGQEAVTCSQLWQ